MNTVGYPSVSDYAAITIEERLEIQDQVARYAWSFDSGHLANYLDRFWPDGVLEHPKRDGTPGQFVGHEGIRAFIGDFEGRPAQSWGHQHQLNTPLLERIAPDSIQVNAYCTVFRHEFHRTYWPVGATFRLGTWHALFTRRENAWRISLLQVRMWTDVSLGETGTELLERPLHSPGTRQ